MKHFPYYAQVARAITSVGLGGLLICGGTGSAIAGGFTQPKGEVFTSVHLPHL